MSAIPLSDAALYSHDSLDASVTPASSIAEVTSLHEVRSPGAVTEGFPSLDDAIREHVIRALRLSRGRIEGRGGAADLLSVNPHTLRGKMRRLKLEWARYRP